jgi:ABC-type antimicrobial peptide transport system permease subunit
LAHEIGSQIHLVVRTDGDPAVLAPVVREIVRELRREAVLDYATTLEARTTESVRTERFAVMMLVGFSALALILAAIGLYTVLSYSVSTRQREIGVRTALGANRSTVAWLVVRDGMRVTMAGLIAGIAGALFVTRFMRAMLFGIEPHDPVSLALAPLVLAAIALVAMVLPARRAMRVDPLIALRSE